MRALGPDKPEQRARPRRFETTRYANAPRRTTAPDEGTSGDRRCIVHAYVIPYERLFSVFLPSYTHTHTHTQGRPFFETSSNDTYPVSDRPVFNDEKSRLNRRFRPSFCLFCKSVTS